MSKEAYCRIIDQFCKECGIADPQAMYTVCDVSILDIPFTITYRETIEAVVFFCDFGSVPDEKRADILQQLLVANLFSVERAAHCFAFNPETNHVLLRGQLPLQDLAIEEFLFELATAATNAKRWRETHGHERSSTGPDAL